MSQIIITCPRCTESTHVDMDHRLTGQRCEHCGSFLYSADTGVKLDVEERRGRRKQWHSLTSTEAQALEGETVDTTDAFQRRGWQTWYIPTFLAGVLVMIIIIINVVKNHTAQSRLKQMPNEPDQVLQTSLQKSSALQNSLQDAPAVEEESLDPAWVKRVQEVGSSFLRATSAEAIMALVRHPAVVGPQVEAFAKQGRLPIAPKGALRYTYSASEDGKLGTLAMLLFENKMDQVQGLVIADGPEGLLVDWPSFSGDGDMTLKDFLAKKPTEPTILRVAARRDDYYNFEYQDRTFVSCLRLTDYPETLCFYGYVLKSSPLYTKISALPMQDHEISQDLQDRAQPLTIKARFHVGTKSENQAEITEIIGNGWFVR
jgi:hypothetical protein